MAKFDLLLEAPKHIMESGDEIHNAYFTIDTADLITFYEWYAFNPHIVTYAVHDNETVGYYNIYPLTEACGQLFDQQAIKEEDIKVSHLLPIEATRHAQYAYLASIAIKNRKDYLNRQCAAALVSSMAEQLIYMYDLTKLKRVFANPTTFNGNMLVRKLGFKPVVSHKKPLKGNDIYALDITPETVEKLQGLAQRYARFINTRPWQINS